MRSEWQGWRGYARLRWFGLPPAGPHRGYRVIQQISRIGPTFAAIFIAEIGDLARFSRPEKLTCWARLTSRHRESDITMRRRAPPWCAGQRLRPADTRAPAPHSPPTAPASSSHGDATSAWLPRPQTAHSGLLRPARRRDPGLGQRGRVSGLGPSRTRDRQGHDSHPVVAWSPA